MKVKTVLGPRTPTDRAGEQAQIEIHSIKHMLSRFGYDVGPDESLYDALYKILDKFHPKDDGQS